VVFRLYCRTPFGRLHQRNPDIIRLAGLIGRTAGAVAMKACNFASLDPNEQARSIKALGNVSIADRDLWKAFLNDSEAVALEAEAAYSATVGKDLDDYVPELGYAQVETSRDDRTARLSPPNEIRMPVGATDKDVVTKMHVYSRFSARPFWPPTMVAVL
jgi:putative restriction endonuclease